MDTLNPTLRMHLWLETPSGMLMGLGRAELLLRIRETGSLNQAAKSMGMSYRAAWGRVKTSEAIAGEALVGKASGSRGFVLTALGERLALAFRDWHNEVEAFALKKAGQAFPWPVKPFEEVPDAGK